ncbi:hypothetical protein [Acidilobus sp.]|uniref:hypothetical protein n=1 Tax=Acidilobus sp. TaxID=1872109 RepID=UPI003D05BFEF
MSREKMKKIATEAREVVKEIRDLGYRCSEPEDAGDCLESYVELNDNVVRLVFLQPRYTDLILIKLTDEVGGCEEAIYSPRGLYVLANNPREAADAIISKAKMLTAKPRSGPS